MVLSTIRNLRKLYAVLGLRQALVFAFHKLRRKQRVRVRVRGLPTPLVCRTNHSDIRVLWQVFAAHGVDVPLTGVPQLIIDGGANVGYTSAHFAHRFPGAEIIAVEPDPENCALLRANCQAYPNVRLIQGALWPTSATLAIDNPAASSWAFRVREVAPATPGSFAAITIPEILRQSNCQMIDLLKLDVEGAEEILFGVGSSEWLDRVRVILVEVHGAAAEEAVRNAVSGSFSQKVDGEKWILTRSPGLPPSPSGPGPAAKELGLVGRF